MCTQYLIAAVLIPVSGLFGFIDINPRKSDAFSLGSIEDVKQWLVWSVGHDFAELHRVPCVEHVVIDSSPLYDQNALLFAKLLVHGSVYRYFKSFFSLAY